MNSVHLTAMRSVLDGLRAMMEFMTESNEWISSSVDVPMALFIVEVAKRAPDKAEFFPHGKWATIQAIQERIDKELDKLKKDKP